MISLNLIKKLSPVNQEKFLSVRENRLVKISSHNGWYRENSKGYTDKSGAWVLPLRHAFDETKHCGPEKNIEFHYAAETPMVDETSVNYRLWKYLADQHNCTLLESDIAEILNIVGLSPRENECGFWKRILRALFGWI